MVGQALDDARIADGDELGGGETPQVGPDADAAHAGQRGEVPESHGREEGSGCPAASLMAGSMFQQRSRRSRPGSTTRCVARRGSTSAIGQEVAGRGRGSARREATGRPTTSRRIRAG